MNGFVKQGSPIGNIHYWQLTISADERELIWVRPGYLQYFRNEKVSNIRGGI